RPVRWNDLWDAAQGSCRDIPAGPSERIDHKWPAKPGWEASGRVPARGGATMINGNDEDAELRREFERASAIERTLIGGLDAATRLRMQPGKAWGEAQLLRALTPRKPHGRKKADRNAAIRREHAAGATTSELAAKHGISQARVYQLIR